MLTGLSLSNFKPFGGDHFVPLAPITLLYGPNSGGKSSIVQALALLKQSHVASPPDPFRLFPVGDLVDLGSHESLIYRHDTSLKLSLGLQWLFRQPPCLPETTGTGGVRYTFESSLDPESGLGDDWGFWPVTSVRFELQDTLRHLSTVYPDLAPIEVQPGPDHLTDGLSSFEWAPGAEQTVLKLGLATWKELPVDVWSTPHESERSAQGSIRHSVARLKSQSDPRRRVWEADWGLVFDSNRRPPRDCETAELFQRYCDATFLQQIRGTSVNSSSHLPPSRVGARGYREKWRASSSHERKRIRAFARSATHFLKAFSDDWSVRLSNVSYLGPLRAQPGRYYLDDADPRSGVGKFGERTPYVLDANADSLPGFVDRWFRRLGIEYTLSVKPIRDAALGNITAILLSDKRTGTRVSPSNVGFGIGQLLPILVEGLVSANRTICVEQPEIHLHPRLQANLADFFIETAGVDQNAEQVNEEPNQWILETHSEALMLRLQRRIREGRLSPKDVKVLYVEPDSEGSRISELRLDDDGEFIDEWPDGFFEESFDEIFGVEDAG